MVPRRSDGGDLVPRKLGELNHIQTDGSASSVNENPSFALDGGGVEWVSQLERPRPA